MLFDENFGSRMIPIKSRRQRIEMSWASVATVLFA